MPKKPTQIFSDRAQKEDIRLMGYSIRTSRYRYTHWVAYDIASFRPDWDDVVARELYDHRSDPEEADNLAEDPKSQKTIGKLLKKIRKTFD